MSEYVDVHPLSLLYLQAPTLWFFPSVVSVASNAVAHV